jgi:hypothetical protein
VTDGYNKLDTNLQSSLCRREELPFVRPNLQSHLSMGDGSRSSARTHGRARIWIRALDRSDDIDKPMTPPGLNVLKMSFLPGNELIFSAVSSSRPGLFVADRNGGIRPLEMGETRYPSVSPNGSWLTYSQLQGGTWNLWLRNLRSGETRRLTNAACNSTEPAWAAGSQTLIYASDCRRALWFSALCRRRIIY